MAMYHHVVGTVPGRYPAPGKVLDKVAALVALIPNISCRDY